MSWFENLLKWSQKFGCCPRPINAFHFPHFPSNCSLSLLIHWSTTNSVFAHCRFSSLSALVASAAGATCGWVAFELPSSKHGAHGVAH